MVLTNGVGGRLTGNRRNNNMTELLQVQRIQ